MAKVRALTPEQFKNILRRRFEGAKKYRSLFEPKWKENYNIIMNDVSRETDQLNLTFDNVIELASGEVDRGTLEIGMNYAFKHLRFFHSQLSANPPSVIARPASTDPDDHRKADAADRLVRHGMKDRNMNEVVDLMTWNTLWAGNGWLKQVWDPEKGDMVDFNEETMDAVMQGDIETYAPPVMNMWCDPDARRWSKVRYTIEKHTMPMEEALFRWPEYEKALTAQTQRKEGDVRQVVSEKTSADLEPQVNIFEYYEKGMPVNGMAGRHAFFLEDYTLLGEVKRNPHYQARLPYHLLTYIDIPDVVYGKSVVEYISHLQDMLNRLDSSTVDSIQSHGVIRMAVPDSAEIEDEAVSNSSWDWIKYSGQQPPSFIPSPALMPDIWRLREALVVAMQEIFGVNDSMLGIQRREQSAVSQQTAIEAGTMIHRRLWKKYSQTVECIYKDYLGLVRKHWSESRTILVLGKGKAFEAADIKGADIAGGFDIQVEYGASLPIDPNMRREAITLLTPLLKEAGMSAKAILQRMKLNDLEGILDRMELAADRQREEFDEMIAKFREGSPIYIEPKELQEHQGRLEYAYTYLETAEFKYLEPELQALIEKHVKDREGFVQQQAAPDPNIQPAGMPGVGGALSPELQEEPVSLEGSGVV